jgi:hypothetical protein
LEEGQFGKTKGYKALAGGRGIFLSVGIFTSHANRKYFRNTGGFFLRKAAVLFKMMQLLKVWVLFA